jgi:hypothetical protein
MQRKLVFVESDIIKELLNKEKMKKSTSMKGNLSASGLDKLTYPTLRYKKDNTVELMVKVMEMMIRL